MKLKLLFLTISILGNSFLFSQTQKDSLSLEEQIEQYEYLQMERQEFLISLEEKRVKKVKQEPEEERIFKVVEDMPHFPGCEGKNLSKEELKNCAEEKLFEFIYGNLKYPASARENKTEGQVIVQFVVAKDGSVQNVRILKDIGNGCGKEVKRVVELMNKKNKKWTPTKSRGKPVKIQFTLPIKFSLDSSPLEKN